MYRLSRRALLLSPAALLLTTRSAHGADEPRGKIVYPRDEGGGCRLHVMNADGSDDRTLPGLTAPVNVFPSWSPDGKRIGFTTMPAAGAQQSQIAVINADGTGLLSINTPAQLAVLLSWSPDGREIAFTSGDQEPSVFLADASGNAVRQLNPPGSAGAGAVWLRDGKTLCYTRMTPDGPKGRIVLVKPDGTGEETLTPEDKLPIAGPNALSPDGKKLIYLSMDMQGRKGNVRIWEFASKAETFLEEVEIPEAGFERLPFPAWAPDGKSYLVPGKTEKGMALFRVSEDGKTRTRLTPEGVNCLAGAWTAAG